MGQGAHWGDLLLVGESRICSLAFGGGVHRSGLNFPWLLAQNLTTWGLKTAEMDSLIVLGPEVLDQAPREPPGGPLRLFQLFVSPTILCVSWLAATSLGLCR